MDLTLLEEIKSKLNFAQMKKPAVIGIAVVLVMVAVASAGRMIMGTATASDFEVVHDQVSSAEAQSDDEATDEEVYVHVGGAVMNPGMVHVGKGARVADAVEAAGGFSEQAMRDAVNLARVLEDGEQVVIPSIEDVEQAREASAAATASLQAGTKVGASATGGTGLVNINTASAEELVALPGIGEATAAKIVSDRAANGSFKTIEDLKRVSGIGDKKFEALSSLICV